MVWRRTRKEFDRHKGAGNRRAFKRIVERSDVPPGVIAYAGDEPVGWCALAPRSDYVALQSSRVLKPIDGQPVWAVSCFFISAGHRGRGIGTALLTAAVAFAKRHGARLVEGYPVVPRGKPMPAAFAWVGVPRLFAAAGFVEAARPSAARRIMRRAT